MERRGRAESIRIPLEVLTFEGFGDEESITEKSSNDRDATNASKLATVTLPPIAQDNTSTTTPETFCVTVDNANITDTDNRQKDCPYFIQLPPITVLQLQEDNQKDEECNTTKYDDATEKPAPVETPVELRDLISSDILQEEVNSLRKSVKQELENARSVILEARIAFLAEKAMKRNTKRRGSETSENGVQEEKEKVSLLRRNSELRMPLKSRKISKQVYFENIPVITGVETAVQTARMKETVKKQSATESRNQAQEDGPTTMFRTTRKIEICNKMGKVPNEAVDEGKLVKEMAAVQTKRQESKLETMTTRDINKNRVSVGRIEALGESNKDFVGSKEKNESKTSEDESYKVTIKRGNSSLSKTMKQNKSEIKASKTNVRAVVTKQDETNEKFKDAATNTNMKVDKEEKNSSTNFVIQENDEKAKFQQIDKKTAMRRKEILILEKRYKVPKDEREIILELYKLQRLEKAENLREVVENKNNAERDLKHAIMRQRREKKEEQKRKEQEKIDRRENEIKMRRMEEENRAREDKKQRELFENAKRRVELIKRREQNLILWDEERNTVLARRTSCSFSFSYFPPLPECRKSSTADLELPPPGEPSNTPDNGFTTLSLLTVPPTSIKSKASARPFRFSPLSSKDTMQRYGSYHSSTRDKR